MNCLNGAEYLREAIDSVFAQSYPHWEIIFFDNASTDNSAAIALGYGERVRFFCGAETIPLGAARNAAIGHARGELIAFLDTDDRWLPQKLEWQVAALEAEQGVAFVYSNFFFLYADTGRTRIGYRLLQPSGQVFASFLRYYPVNLQTVIVRRHALLGMDGLFDPTLDVSEEYDLFIRLLHVAQALYLAQPTAIYRVHAKMASVLRNDRYPVENEYILNKLRQKIPNLDRSYPDEVRYLEAKIGYWYAVSYVAKGERLKARDRLRPHTRVALEFLILFFATYFPIVVWRLLFSLKATVGLR